MEVFAPFQHYSENAIIFQPVQLVTGTLETCCLWLLSLNWGKLTGMVFGSILLYSVRCSSF